jgi:hypothetical protein
VSVRREIYPLEKITLKLRKGDFQWLQDMHPKHGAAKAVRNLIIEHRERVERKTGKLRQYASEEV